MPSLCSISSLTYSERVAWGEMNMEGAFMVSKNTSAAFSRFRAGFNGASVSSTYGGGGGGVERSEQAIGRRAR